MATLSSFSDDQIRTAIARNIEVVLHGLPPSKDAPRPQSVIDGIVVGVRERNNHLWEELRRRGTA